MFSFLAFQYGTATVPGRRTQTKRSPPTRPKSQTWTAACHLRLPIPSCLGAAHNTAALCPGLETRLRGPCFGLRPATCRGGGFKEGHGIITRKQHGRPTHVTSMQQHLSDHYTAALNLTRYCCNTTPLESSIMRPCG